MGYIRINLFIIIVMANGLPVSGKSLAVSIPMAIIGEHTSIGG